MTIINTYAAETWNAVYQAFSQINFISFDFTTVKESLLQYVQIYYAEDFNNLIESDEFIMLVETFAYASELLSYRIDQGLHENLLPTAQRKQSILRLVNLINYQASRNIPARGLAKLNTISTTDTVYDSLGNNLANKIITWNDPNNTNWQEQFMLVANQVLSSPFGTPSKSFQIADVLMQQYAFNNTISSFNNGVFPFTATGTTDTVPMEVVPVDINSNGPFERSPDLNAQFNVVYASDGRGYSSSYTGFLMLLKQGTMTLTNYNILEPIANRRLVLSSLNVNDTDVWVYGVDSDADITQIWTAVPSLVDQSLAFNNQTSRFLYAIETLENDQIAINFGDGNYSNIPSGQFQLWTRSSVNENITIPQNSIVNQAMGFTYLNAQNVQQTCNVSFSLISALQNNAPSETIEHIRQAAPSVYYSQNRMVNGQDYNTFMLQDSTILKLNTINRTFAGQPKYIEWNDASGAYQNIKLFGDDLTMNLSTTVDMIQTSSSSQGLIDSYITPILSSTEILNTLTHQLATGVNTYGIITYPRTVFIEDNRKIYKDINGSFVVPYGYNLDNSPLQSGDGSLNEKTVIQGALDSHWYGDPLSTVTINSQPAGVIPDPILDPESDSNLYISNLPRTIDGINIYPPGDTGSGLQPIQRQQFFGLKFNTFLSGFGTGTISLFNPDTNNGMSGQTGLGYGPAEANGLSIYATQVETFTLEMTSDGTTFTVISNLRGSLPNYSLTLAATTPNGRWSEQTMADSPIDFAITVPSMATAFSSGDAFVIDVSYQTISPNTSPTWNAYVRAFGSSSSTYCINTSGWWELIPSDVLTAPVSSGGVGLFTSGSGDGPNLVQAMTYDMSSAGSSWIFLVSRTDDGFGNTLNWSIYNRDMKIIANSPTTNFWFNQNSQIIDPETLLPLYDKIRILRSNINAYGQPLPVADIYDCVNFAYDSNGVVITNSLELLPTNTIDFTQSGTAVPENILQFEAFAQNSYQYTLINISDPSNPVIDTSIYPNGIVPCGSYSQVTGYDLNPYDISAYDSSNVTFLINGFTESFSFNPGNFMSSIVNNTYQLARQLFVPAPSITNPQTQVYGCNLTPTLDYMWQHWTPDSNLIDPSPSNIHDAYILTSGYYSSVMNYVTGISNIIPSLPTPLDLLTSYGYLLENKMLSDTVVLHSGNIKLLFGSLADQTLRAKFRVVMNPSATFSTQRVQQEVINVINTYFNIQNWNFGDTFYATELLGLIHQSLPTQISSVVLVPTYSVNSFGSLFSIDSGLNEVLQSCAQVSDVEIVTNLSSTVLRQN